MKTFVCVIESRFAMLQHRFADAEETEETSRPSHIKKKDPREEAEKAAYRTAAGELYVPGEAVARMMREAGGNHKQKGTRKSWKYVIPSAVLVPEDQILLRDKEGNPICDYEVDSRPVVIPSTKGRIMRHRPRLNKWFLEFHLEIDENMIDPDFVLQLLQEAGSKLGLLDFRPEKGGRFGRFQVVSWAILAEKLPLAAD